LAHWANLNRNRKRNMTDNDARNQKNYRRLLNALSRPGRIVGLEGVDRPSPAAAAMAVGACLLDSEVSFCVMGRGDIDELQSALAAATQARPAAPEEADFIFFRGGESRGEARRAKRGGPQTPEEGATLVYCLDSTGPAAPERLRIRLTGPGIAGQDGIAPEMGGIVAEEFRLLMAVNADYPLGVDAFFIQPDGELMGLPRSTRIHMR
jgi:alpha-D-ribose 1-methylphosphonate 5-triphosphate synthase subunit PhnH